MGEIERLCEVSKVSRAEIEALGELDDSRYAVLRTAFENARERRTQELGEAVDNGLTMLPTLVRLAVRRMLFS